MKRNIITNYLSIIFLFLSSLTISMAGFADYHSKKSIVIVLSYALSLSFWSFLLIGWLMRLRLFCALKKDKLINGTPITLSIFSNIYAIIADIVLVLSIALLLLASCFSFPVIYKLISISLIVFTAQMHFVLNGKILKYINKSRGERENERG